MLLVIATRPERDHARVAGPGGRRPRAPPPHPELTLEALSGGPTGSCSTRWSGREHPARPSRAPGAGRRRGEPVLPGGAGPVAGRRRRAGPGRGRVAVRPLPATTCALASWMKIPCTKPSSASTRQGEMEPHVRGAARARRLGRTGRSATPTITDKYVYAVGTFGHGFCFERKTGKIVWKHNFREESPYLDGKLKDAGNLEWKGFNGSLVPIGDKIVMFYWQGGNPAIPAWAKTEVTDKMQVFAYNALTGKVVWKFEETCAPGTRGPGLVTGSGLPITFNKEDCIVIHGNREWKILRLADGKQVWNWECSGPNEAPAWASGGLQPVGTNLYIDELNGWQKALVECDFSLNNQSPGALDEPASA